MTTADRHAHWEHVYATKDEREVSWFQPDARPSLAMIDRAGLGADAAIIDIGGGSSRLVDALIERGFQRLTVLDIAEHALTTAQRRLAERAESVEWIAADVTAWQPPAQRFDLWHDRAAFHFLTDANDRAAYRTALLRALRPRGFVIIATFAPDGPERCSGLPVMRYDAAALSEELGAEFELLDTLRDDHQTPGGATQRFQFTLLQRH